MSNHASSASLPHQSTNSNRMLTLFRAVCSVRRSLFFVYVHRSICRSIALATQWQLKVQLSRYRGSATPKNHSQWTKLRGACFFGLELGRWLAPPTSRWGSQSARLCRWAQWFGSVCRAVWGCRKLSRFVGMGWVRLGWLVLGVWRFVQESQVYSELFVSVTVRSTKKRKVNSQYFILFEWWLTHLHSLLYLKLNLSEKCANSVLW